MSSLKLMSVLGRRWNLLGGTALLVIWVLAAYYRLATSRAHVVSLPTSAAPIDAFDFAPTKSDAISNVCQETAWNPDLIFTCDNSFGGVGNVRNSVLSCVRYAISAGAALVVPSILLRNASDIAQMKTGRHAPLSHMFDTQHFTDSLQLSCPSLKIYQTESDIPERKTFKTMRLAPESIVRGRIPLTGLVHPEQWRETFYKWLEKPKTKVTSPKIVALGRSYMKYPIYSDGESFALEFGNILKFRPDTRRLATAALKSMAGKYDLKLDFSRPILPHAFFGVHLRTEEDAVKAWSAVWKYGRYETQSAYYLRQASRSKTSVIYVASGDPNEVAKFASDAKQVHMAVTTKMDLLQGKEKEELLNLAWDQQALVDFLILEKGTDFAGIGHSSFAWNIALKRRVYAKQKEKLAPMEWEDGDIVQVDGEVLLKDELNQIYGIKRPEYEACLWP